MSSVAMITLCAFRNEDLRSALNLHRSDLIVAPAHSLQGGVVIVYLPLATYEVLPLKQNHLGLLVVLLTHKTVCLAKSKVKPCCILQTGDCILLLFKFVLVFSNLS